MKAHHSFCDGVSVMCMTLSLSEEYSRDYFIKSSDAKWYEALFVRLLGVIKIPFIAVGTVLEKKDQNYIQTRKEKPFSGDLNVASSKQLDFRLLKLLSKKIDVTINDIVTSALSTSMNVLFKDNNDLAENFSVVMPANIRFKFYASPQDIKLENKFAAIPLKIPLTASMPEAYPKIQKVTKVLKNSISQVYAMYALTYWSNALLPRYFPK